MAKKESTKEKSCCFNLDFQLTAKTFTNTYAKLAAIATANLFMVIN